MNNARQTLYPCNFTSLFKHKSNIDGVLWHERLGHPHQHVVNLILKGINLTPIEKSSYDLCSAFQMGKSHRLHTLNVTLDHYTPLTLFIQICGVLHQLFVVMA